MNIFRTLNGLGMKNEIVSAVAVFMARELIFVMAGIAVVIGLAALFGGSDARRAHGSARNLILLVRSAIASSCAILDGLLISLFLFRERPFAALDDVNLLIASPFMTKSFPSDHATIAFAIAVSVLFVNRRWGLVLLVCAAAVAVGRVMVGVHYPSDVLFGALLGSAWAVAVAVLGRSLGDERWMGRQLDHKEKRRAES